MRPYTGRGNPCEGFLDISGDYSEGETPVPIPNTAVKPLSADGTALTRGRVGRRRIKTKSLHHFTMVEAFRFNPATTEQ